MYSLFMRIINGYLNQSSREKIPSSEYYNHLPLIFRVQAHNNLSLAEDYESRAIILPPRANAKNMKIAERMRRYASYRTTR